MKILALDTATELCSAALWIDGACLSRESGRPRASGELILGMIAELLAQAGFGLERLDMIAFGRGPGAFTGVRLAVAVAQGLGFAAGVPLLTVSELRALAQLALAQQGAPARDVAARYAQHVAGAGARYTRANPPQKLLAKFACPNQSVASRIEAAIKKLAATDKKKLVGKSGVAVRKSLSI